MSASAREQQSVVHRGRWSQTNGWALSHHSSSTFLASRSSSMGTETPFSFSVVQRWFCAAWLANGQDSLINWKTKKRSLLFRVRSELFICDGYIFYLAFFLLRKGLLSFICNSNPFLFDMASSSLIKISSCHF
jgi:hypothetical protein